MLLDFLDLSGMAHASDPFARLGRLWKQVYPVWQMPSEQTVGCAWVHSLWISYLLVDFVVVVFTIFSALQGF